MFSKCSCSRKNLVFWSPVIFGFQFAISSCAFTLVTPWAGRRTWNL